MGTILQNFLTFLKRKLSSFSTHYNTTAALIKQNLPKHSYKVISFEQDEEENYIAVVQVASKQQIFRMRPEEILASDHLTDLFSQRDIRALTYLGYLDINAPKYRVLAKRLMENDTMLFAIRERGRTKPIVKTANQISSDEALLSGLNQKDAHMIGYIQASEQIHSEKVDKKHSHKSIET